MSTTAEPPVKTNEMPELPPLHEAFQTVVKQMETDGKATAEAQAKEPPKKEVKQPEKKQPEAKEPEKKEPTKPEVKGKKKDALDSVLSEETPEAKPEPDEVQQLLESKDPNWDKARETMRKQIEELKVLRETAKKASEPAPEITTKLKTLTEEREKMAAELAQYKDAVMALDVSYDPSVIAKKSERENMVQSLANRLKNAGGDTDSLLSAMAMPLDKRAKALDAALDGIESSRERSIIETKLAQIELKDEELSQILSNPARSLSELQKSRELQEQQAFEKAEAFKQALFEKTRAQLPKLSKFMREASPDAEGAEKFNADLKADIERAPSLVTAPAEEVPILAFKAARYDSLERIATERFARDAETIRQLEESLSRYEGGEMKHRGDGKPVTKAIHELPIEEVFQRALSGQQPI